MFVVPGRYGYFNAVLADKGSDYREIAVTTAFELTEQNYLHRTENTTKWLPRLDNPYK